jgi:hypothetical protein
MEHAHSQLHTNEIIQVHSFIHMSESNIPKKDEADWSTKVFNSPEPPS